MSDNRKVAAAILAKAKETVTTLRPGVHGSAENSFAMIGEMWEVYLRHINKVRGNQSILPQDVAQMMVTLKQCRAVYGDQTNDDNFVDAAGYIGLAGMLQLPADAMKPKSAAIAPVATKRRRK